MNYRIEPPPKYKVGDCIKYKKGEGPISVSTIERIQVYVSKKQIELEYITIIHYGIKEKEILCKLIEVDCSSDNL